MSDPRTIALENALKALGINPDDNPLHHAKRWISGRDDDRRERDSAVAERDNAVARVTARDMRIADLEHDLAAKDANRAEATLAEMVKALDDVGAPKVYTCDDGTERPIPDHERIRLLGERVWALRAQLREATDATAYLNAIIEAHNALDALGAPRLADGTALTAAARIRAIPR